MTLHTRKLLSFSCRKSAKGNSLIQLHIISNSSRFTDYYASAMVNKEIFPNRSTWVNIYSCVVMSILCHNPWNKRNLLQIKDVCQTIHINCQKSRIGENNLLFTLRSRVTIKTSLHIFQQHLLHFRKLLKKSGGYLCCLAACTGHIIANIQKSRLNLRLHTVKQVIEQISGIMFRKNSCSRINIEISRKNNWSHFFHNINNRCTDWKMSSALCQKQLFLTVIGSQTLYCILYGCLFVTHNWSPRILLSFHIITLFFLRQ